MIKNPNVIAEIQNHWRGVRQLQQVIRNNTTFCFASGGITVGNLSSLAHNLPLLNACAVLQDSLLQMRAEGVFACGNIFFGALHKASKNLVPWVDWILIQDVIKERNRLAHDAVVVPVNDCLRFVDAIEQELIAWNLLKKS